jgi:flagellar protein FlbD
LGKDPEFRIGHNMILVTRLNHSVLVLNSDLIETIETAPDTVVSLISGQKLIVLESPEEIVERVVKFRRAIVAPPFPETRRTPTANSYPAAEFRGGNLAAVRDQGKEEH